MSDVTYQVETDVRERILVIAERLFREIGYQKTTVADIAKALQMSPANVYRFFEFQEVDQCRRRPAIDGGGRASVAGYCHQPGKRQQAGCASC